MNILVLWIPVNDFNKFLIDLQGME